MSTARLHCGIRWLGGCLVYSGLHWYEWDDRQSGGLGNWVAQCCPRLAQDGDG